MIPHKDLEVGMKVEARQVRARNYAFGKHEGKGWLPATVVEKHGPPLHGVRVRMLYPNGFSALVYRNLQELRLKPAGGGR